MWSWPGVELRLGVVRWALAGGGVDGRRRGLSLGVASAWELC